MKKLIYCATALVAALFAASCQREMHEPVAEGGVTYTITLPETVQTRGESGYAEYDLYYEVYKTIDATELQTASILFEKKVTMTGNTYELTLDLLNDQDYTVLFWANKKGEDYFDLADLRKVTMKQAASNNNDRDAFCGIDQISQHDGAKSKTVTLTRPFAQLNIATLVSTTAGYDLTPQSSYVKVSDVPVTYNVATGDVSGDKEVEFTVNTVPAGKKVNDTYDLVAMNYVLVPAGTVSVYYEINTVNGTVKNTINNVPLKKNYRTNIIGNLLTSNATYTVEIKPGFEEGAYVGPEFVDEPAYNADTKTWTVTSAKELLWVAASVNGTLGLNTKSAETARNFDKEIIVLANDIDLQGAEWEPIGNKEHAFAGTFDGQEYTVSNFKVTEKAGWAGLFGRVQGTVKNLNVKNVTIEANHYAGAIVGQGYVYMDNCHAENVDITVTIDREADGGKGDYGDKAGGLVGQNCEGGLKITNSSAKNVTITGYRDLGGIVGMAHNHNIVTGNTVENITLVQNLEYGYQATIPTTLGGIVGRFGSNVKYEGNTESGVVYDYPTVLSYDSTKSAVENGQILFDTVMAAEDGDIILLTAGDWRGTDGQTSRYTVNKDVTIIGFEEGVVLSSDKYGRVVDSDDADNKGVVTFKNLTMKTDHAWAAALYAKNYVTVNLIDVTLQTAGTTAILLDSSNDINNQHHNANTIVNVTNVTIDEGDYVELNANPCTSYQTDIVSYASFNYDETSNIGIVKPQGITRSTGDNLFVNGVALPAGYFVTDTYELKATSGRADASLINLFPGEYELSGVAFTANNVTLKGVDKVKSVLNLSKSIYLQDKVVNLENLTYKVPTGLVYNEHAFSFIHHAKEFNLTNCNSEGRLRLNVYKSTIDGCAFNINTTSGFDGYAFYYYGNDGSKVEVKNSTFTTAGKAICIYSESAKVYDLTVTNCSFTSSNASTDKAAIQMHTEYGISGKLAINECTATGFADINDGLFNELNNNTKVPTNKFAITVDGTAYVAPVIVTPENIATTDFNQSKTFKLKGDFTSVTSMPSITPTEGVVAVIDASGATFGDKIQFNIPQVPGNSNVVSRDNARKGSYTLTNFHGTTLDLGAYGTSVTITKSTLDCIDVFAANIALDINHNTIDSNYEMHPRCNSGETDYAVYMMMMAYDLKFDGNTASNAIGHVVAINGSKGTWGTSVANSGNEVKSFTGNTITGISGSTKNNRAGFKVWDDLTYAFQGESTYEALPQAGQALINAVEYANTFKKAEGTSNNAYRINFYEYYHAAL